MTYTQEQCERAFYNTSHMPEKRGAMLFEYYTRKLSELPQEKHARFNQLFGAYLSAETKCASAFIVGPARFPVERQRKRTEWAAKHWQKLEWFCANTPERFKPTLTDSRQKLEELKAGHENKHYWARTLSKAKIERLESNIQAIETFKGGSYTWGTVENHKEDQRIRFFFNDRPSAETIAMLKKNGMKWSPKNKAWQRQTTPNALQAVRRIIQEIA